MDAIGSSSFPNTIDRPSYRVQPVTPVLDARNFPHKEPSEYVEAAKEAAEVRDAKQYFPHLVHITTSANIKPLPLELRVQQAMEAYKNN